MSETWRVCWASGDNHPRAADCTDEPTAQQVVKALADKGIRAVAYSTPEEDR